MANGMADPRVTALQHLPHGSEFRFLDELTALNPGRSGTGTYRIPNDLAFLKGHFPGDPLLPGVILVEAAAQLAGTIAQSDPDRPPLPNLRLTGIRVAKITGTARPGDQIILQAEISGRLENLVQAHATATSNGQLLLTTDIILSGD